jgi:hypothetical protein
MAKPPLICKTDLANSQIQQGGFDKCTFVVTKDSAIMNSFSLCDYSLDIDNFFTQTLRLRGGAAFLIDDAGLGNEFGEISFLLVYVTYPTSFTIDTDKYINLIYDRITYPVAELHIWTGEPGANAGSGITIFPNGSEIVSPYLDSGGVVLHNPHSNYVDLKIIIASKGNIRNTSANAPAGLLTSQDGEFIILDDQGDYLIQ